MPDEVNPAICPGCGHLLRMHFKNVLDEMICLCSWEHTSSGVIMAFTMHCDCVNGRSEAVERRKWEEDQERVEREKHFKELFVNIRKVEGIDQLLRGDQ